MLSFLRKPACNKAVRPMGSGLLGFRVAPGVKASSHSQGIVLMNSTRGTVFSANRAGAMIWNGVSERWPLDRIVESISREFQVQPMAAQHDAREFVAQLAAEGLLVRDAN